MFLRSERRFLDIDPQLFFWLTRRIRISEKASRNERLSENLKLEPDYSHRSVRSVTDKCSGM